MFSGGARQEIWDTKVKPEAVAIHRGLQRVDLAALSDSGLWAHAERCMANSQYAGGLHAYFGQVKASLHWLLRDQTLVFPLPQCVGL
jgi:hypothetical protein